LVCTHAEEWCLKYCVKKGALYWSGFVRSRSLLVRSKDGSWCVCVCVCVCVCFKTLDTFLSACVQKNEVEEYFILLLHSSPFFCTHTDEKLGQTCGVVCALNIQILLVLKKKTKISCLRQRNIYQELLDGCGN